MLTENQILDEIVTARHIEARSRTNINIWHGVTTQPNIELKKVAWKSGPANYSILYNMIPDSLKLEKIGNDLQFYKPTHPVMLLLPQNVELEFAVKPDVQIELLELQLTPEYAENIAGNDIWFCKCSPTTAWQLEDLLTCCLKDDPDADEIVALHDQILKLSLYELIGANEPGKKRSPYFDRMQALRKIVENNLKTDLPPLTTLAQETGLTVSTMQRHFKMHFGQNIYEFYLQKKMDLAEKLIYRDGMSVNDTAELLGYASVSNFIDIFKKNNGRSPGKVKGARD